MSSLSNATPPGGLRPSHTHAQFYGPSGHDSFTTVSRTSALGPTLSALSEDLIYRIMKFDPSSALTLCETSRALEHVAHFFLSATTVAVINENAEKGNWWSAMDEFVMKRLVITHVNLELEKDYARSLRSNNVQYRSCVLFHRSIVILIRDMGVACPNLILTPREVRLFDVKVKNHMSQLEVERPIRKALAAMGYKQLAASRKRLLPDLETSLTSDQLEMLRIMPGPHQALLPTRRLAPFPRDSTG